MAAAAQLEARGRTAVFAGWHGQVRGVLAVADTVKVVEALVPPVRLERTLDGF